MSNIREAITATKKRLLVTTAILMSCILTGMVMLTMAVSAHNGQNNQNQHVYAYFYNTGTQDVGSGNPVIFDTPGIRTQGVMQDGMGNITVPQSGDYEVHFSVTTDLSNLFALADNGTVIPGTQYLSNTSTPCCTNLGVQNNGLAIVHLTTWSKLTLQNESTTPGIVHLVPLFTGRSSQLTVNASIKLVKIG